MRNGRTPNCIWRHRSIRQRFRSLLDKLPHPYLKANYDSGNSSSLGYDVREEIAAYGERIGSVHIKDRVRGGGTVPLGTGDAEIPVLLSELSRIGYKGDFVMQIARGEAGQELAWIRQNRENCGGPVARCWLRLVGATR